MKKAISVMTCAAFLIFEGACTHIVTQNVKEVNPAKNQGVEIMKVMKKSGEVVNFPEKRPGRIENDAVVGESLATTGRNVVIPKANVKSVRLFERGVTRPEIQEIRTKTGEVYSLKDNPNITSIKEEEEYYVVDRYVVTIAGREVVIPKDNVKSVSRFEGGIAHPEIQEIKTKTGGVYRLKDDPSISSIREEGDRYIVVVLDRTKISISFSEIDLVWAKRTDTVATFFAVLGGAAVVGLGVFAIIALTKESCPFIYSYDGTGFIFDAEPYGGATSVGLKRTEWCGLEHLKETNGEYRIRITNEVDETQHTDELKLVVVDHPQGTRAIPDELGGVHTVAQPVVPLAARDKKGRDILPLVRENDWIYWQSRLEEKKPDDPADIRDELIFEFPKPAGATKAKLLFNGCNTLWASQMVKRFLELYGEEVTKCYAAVNAKGTAYENLMNWNLREELYRLQIRAETKEGWVSKGTVVGGGPFISEDKVYTLDLSDTSGDTLKIKFLPPAGFWMLNYLAVDYTDDLSVETIELAPARAVDSTGHDIREALSKNDEEYYVMPNTGNWADVSFLAPPSRPGLTRMVLCKASGFYDIHLDAAGKPRLDILGRFLTEPGFAACYALQEYFRWTQENSPEVRK